MQRTPRSWVGSRLFDAARPSLYGDARHNRSRTAANAHQRIAAQRISLRDLALLLEPFLEPGEPREAVGRDDRVGFALRTRLSKRERNAHERNGHRVSAIHQWRISRLARQSGGATMRVEPGLATSSNIGELGRREGAMPLFC